MKRIVSLLLCAVMIFTGCTFSVTENQNTTDVSETQTITSLATEGVTEQISEAEGIDEENDYINQFTDLSDPELLQYIEDDIYAELEYQLESDDYVIENVTASYISQEYLDEVAFNSQSNIYFGYTLAELDELFQDTKYVFTLSDTGETTVHELVEIKDTTNEEILKNVAIGTGVIVICVTVSYFTAGTATPTVVSAIFTTGAKTATTAALSSAAIGGAGAGIIKGYQTGDMNAALKSAALVGSEEFKWGAIAGAVAGGASKAHSIYRSSKVVPTPRASEIKVLDMTDDAIEQVSYFKGKKVSSSTKGATRPDVVIQNADGTVRAIEVKNYNLESTKSKSNLLRELERQVTSRVDNLPTGSTQEIVLDVRGRGFSTKLIDDVIVSIKEHLNNVYYDIPVEILRW